MKTVEHSWFRRRGYLHFDEPVSESKAAEIAQDPQSVERHAFYPLISYNLSATKLGRDPITGRLKRKVKERRIAYAAHVDSHIFAYYAFLLGQIYEKKISEAGIANSVLAFRPLGLSNIDFAAQAFDEVKARGNCAVVALDVTGFFDNLDHQFLRGCWASMLGAQKLPSDHYAVWRAVTKYSHVDRASLYAEFGISPGNPRFGRRRICSPTEFRSRVRGKKLVEKNTNTCGIPQGTPISALLSNMYMFDFDKKVRALVEERNGRYLRYCDDIFIVVPKRSRNKIAGEVRNLLNNIGLDINTKKTEISQFTRERSGRISCDRPLQYLGFLFDGERVILRSAALARYSERMKKGVRLAAATASSRNATRQSHGRVQKTIYKRSLYLKYSHLGGQNFVRYGYRAARMFGSEAIRAQLKPLWQRLQDEIAKQQDLV